MISIIVTHKMNLSYLRDCLDSIAEQNYKDVETILILDHTEEDITQIEERYREQINLRVYELSEDKAGVSAGRNLGMEKAKGEYILFLDNDDYLYGQSLDAYLSVMDEKTEVVYGQLKRTWFKREAYLSGETQGIKGEEEKLQKLDFSDPIQYCIERYDKLEGLTVLGALYRSTLFKNNNITFDESQYFYADTDVVAAIFSAANHIKGTKDALYIKRQHNDKQNNPALEQYPREDMMADYVTAYQKACKAATNRRVKRQLDAILTKFIFNVFPKEFCYGEDNRWREEFYDRLWEAAQELDKNVIVSSKINKLHKKFVFAFIEEKKEKMGKKAKRLLALKRIQKICKSKKALKEAITEFVFDKMPIKENWIVFESFLGRNCSGQPKYIYQYLEKNYGDKYKYIWIVDRKDVKIEGKHKKCKRWSLSYYYYMNRSKYWVNNMRQPLSVRKRPETIIVATWHGTPLKRLVFDMGDLYSATPEYKDIVYRQTRVWNYLLSDNPYSTEKFQRCFLLEKEYILEAGYPANDPMYAPDREEKALQIKKKLGIAPDKKVIMYAPTWRDDNYHESGKYGFDLGLDIDWLKKEFDDEYVLLLRMHYFVVDRFDMTQFGDFAVDVCNYDDVTELYLITDILLTDYSSVFFDYANLKRPVLFYMYDLEKYRDNLRGFYLDIHTELPGPILETNEEVIDAIRNIDQIQCQYEERYQEFYDRFCCIDDGHASQRVVETVFQ